MVSKHFDNMIVERNDAMTTGPLEIERKFLISLEQTPAAFAAMLHYYCEKTLKVSTISQTYLIAEEGERRVRKRTTDGKTEFFYTEKFTISGIKRIENECEITEDEYTEYLSEADSKLKTIEKTRYTFQFDGQTIEIDIYAFSTDKAILEIELPSEDTAVSLPHFIHVIREVTEDKAYKNKSLAKTPCL